MKCDRAFVIEICNQNLLNMQISMFSILFTLALSNATENSNQHFSYTLNTSADSETIWSIWTDVPNWKSWDTGLQDAEIEEAFQLNAKGKIISLEGRTSKFEVTAFEAGKTYTIRTKLPFGSLYVKRYLSEESGQLSFTHEVWFTGFSKGLFGKLFGSKFKEILPGVLENVKKIAEQK